MSNVIEQMVSRYEIRNTSDRVNALREIIQEIILTALSRGGFFNKAVLYGSTASRMFYKLDRFTDDLDFVLITRDNEFDLSKYFDYIEKELKAYGINLLIVLSDKSYIFRFITDDDILKNIEIRFRVDIKSSYGATYEYMYKLLPSYHDVGLYDKESLFAININLILCNNRGRDLYDYIFFLANNVSVNMELVRNKLIDSNYIDVDSNFDIDVLRKLLVSKFEEIDYKNAKEDVLPFIRNIDGLDMWSREFFINITSMLKGN